MTKPYRLEFEINALPSSPNTLLGAHWTVRSSHAKKWLRMVDVATMGKRPATALIRAVVRLERHSSKEPDADNGRLSFKCILDALVKLGVLHDDRPSVIGEPVYVWRAAPMRKGKVRVRVESVE